MKLDQLLERMHTVAVVCNQWGDTGKGKIVDNLAAWADVIARGTGGANAGHTIYWKGLELILHLIPSGIVYDGEGKTNIIGSGVAFDPREVNEELKILNEHGLSYNNLRLAYNAKLLMPQHIVIDRIRESTDGEVKIGTTGRGIGPCYGDHTLRKGLNVNDLLNKDVFRKKLEDNLQNKIKILKLSDPEAVKEVMHHEHLMKGIFYDPQKIFDIDAMIEVYTGFGETFRPIITDTDDFIRKIHGKLNLLLEGAQGALLSVDEGTKPYVTSSNPTAQGLAKGVGLTTCDIDIIFGIVKAFYITRVGEGPFPTEMGRKQSEAWCGDYNNKKEVELKLFPNPDINSKDEFEQGVAVRLAGNEYGATTKRPRRTGWLDLPLLKHAVKFNGDQAILTKVDVLSDCEDIKICKSYTYEGPDYYIGGTLLTEGTKITTAYTDSFVLQHCKPNYEVFPGWKSDISSIDTYENLPPKLRNIVSYVEDNAKVNVRAISTGPKRDQLVVKG